MSFSSDLKNELIESIPKSIHCKYAELAGIIAVNGRMESAGGDKTFIIRVENDDLQHFVIRLLKMVTGISESEVSLVNEKLHHRKIVIPGKAYIEDLYTRLKLREVDGRINVDNILTQRSCCKKAYVKGAFLAGGSMVNPEKSYHMEIAFPTDYEAEKIRDILVAMQLSAGIIDRKERKVVYIKDSDAISNTIGVMGAPKTLMEFENIRILKDIRNSINREVNCDTANMAKTASAAAKQIEDINFIIAEIGLDGLPENLREMAEIRIQYPYLSLKELGEKLNPPLGKSGINHRLSKLSDIAKTLKNK